MSDRSLFDNPTADLADLLAAGWTLNDSETTLSKTFKFKDFKSAFAWMTQISFEAEALDHHPDWKNVYNRVEVSLSTHSSKGLTQLDKDLAERMDALA